ncbi:hypothetical protein JCM14469_21350 [Desulfatiferula olefinivorans]
MDSTLLHTILIWMVIGLFFFVLTTLAVTDVLRKQFGSTRVKTFWGLIALVPFIGWLIYLLLGYRKGRVATP